MGMGRGDNPEGMYLLSLLHMSGFSFPMKSGDFKKMLSLLLYMPIPVCDQVLEEDEWWRKKIISDTKKTW